MKKIFVVEARFYEDIADKLFEGALKELEKSGYKFDKFSVPGAFEIPAAINFAIQTKKYDGYIALGCVIRGQTTHYDYVCTESARGLNDLALQYNVAIGYGIITAENREQANVRADANAKNVGGRAAKACFSMIELKAKLGAA